MGTPVPNIFKMRNIWGHCASTWPCTATNGSPRKKNNQNTTPERNDDPPQKNKMSDKGQRKKKKKDHACPVRQAHTHAHVNCMKTHRCRPLPFPRSRLRDPRGGAGRARSRAAARRLPRTPFSCRQVGRGGPRLGVEARTGSLGRGRRGWMRLRMDAWGFGELNACPLACLRVQGTGRGGYSTWEVVSRYRLVVVAPTVWNKVTLRTAAALAAVSAVVGTTQVLLVAKFTLCCVLVSSVLRLVSLVLKICLGALRHNLTSHICSSRFIQEDPVSSPLVPGSQLRSSQGFNRFSAHIDF